SRRSRFATARCRRRSTTRCRTRSAIWTTSRTSPAMPTFASPSRTRSASAVTTRRSCSSVSTTDKWATFDCYGTRIDWNGGIRRALGSDELVQRYHEVEPQVEAENPSASYRDVMTEVSRRLGVDDPEALARSLPSWEPFPEVRAALGETRERGWKLA